MAIDDNASYELTGYQVKDLASKIRAKADSTSLASVATSGLYSDLTGAPTIPTVYNGTLTLQQNGSTLGTFSANQSGNETINFTSGGKLNNLWWGIEDPEHPDYKNLYAGDPTTLPVLINFPGVSTMFDEGMIQLIDQVDDQTYVVVSIDSTNYSILAVRADGSSGAKEFVTFSTTSGSSSTWTKTVTSLEPFTGATSGAAGTSGLVPAPTTSDPDKFLKGDGTWGTPTDTTYSDFTGATASVAGAHGLVPAPAAGDNTKFLRGDGTWQTLMNAFYPVGSIYMSATLATAADVEAALGGTWTAWGAGRVPVGVDTNDTDFDTAEETGGEKTHTLTTTEMPSHNHTSKGWAAVADGSGSYVTLGGAGASTDYSTNNRGGDGAHNNLQPYITCYMYKRTA